LLLVLLSCLAASPLATPLAAQVTTAGTYGTVNDRSGAIVPNADVTVTNTDNNFTRTLKSDSAGEYALTALPLGPYRIEAALTGFKKFVQTGVVLDVNRTTKVDNERYAGFFAQDDIRLHPRFTLNLGLRYERPLPVTDPHDRKMAFEPGVHSTIAPNAPVGLLFPGDPGIGRGIIQAPHRNFAPRVGMAWDPSGDGKTSIRAAAGIFWDSISSNIMNLTTDFQPFAARQTFPTVNTLADPYKTIAGGSPFPITYDPKNPKFITPADVSTISPAFKFPYTYQLNFSMQRQIRKDLSVTAAYVGSLAHRLPFSVDRNYAGWTPGATAANLNTRRPTYRARSASSGSKIPCSTPPTTACRLPWRSAWRTASRSTAITRTARVWKTPRRRTTGPPAAPRIIAISHWSAGAPTTTGGTPW
jgi:Carboxypeptidase regulatory-like domain/TonB dependent receptor